MPRILIVEDSPTIRLMLRDALEKTERRNDPVFEASTAREAEIAFEKTEADVVFLDLTLPDDEDAVALMKRLLAERPRTRVVLVSAFPEDAPCVVEAFSDGAYAYVPKPVQSEAVVKVFERMDTDDGVIQRIA